MLVSARHFPTNSEVSTSQISAFGLTNNFIVKSRKVEGVSSIDDQSEIPIEGQSFFRGKRKLLSSGSSPEIDLSQLIPNKKRAGVNAFNSSIKKLENGQISTKSR